MNVSRRKLIALGAGFVALAGAATPLLLRHSLHYLPENAAAFVAIFPTPPARDSPQARRELDELLGLQTRRTPAETAAAQADARKDVSRFYGALGLDAAHAPKLPKLAALTDDVEADVSAYVSAPKNEFHRLRPYRLEPRIKPCIGGTADEESYPSGHATYGYVMTDLLAGFVPERRAALLERGDEYARQRMVCGVHFRSDIEAGRSGAHWLVDALRANPEYRREAEAARSELRAALGLP